MKRRSFVAIAQIVALALVLTLVPEGGRASGAQDQPAAPADRARSSVEAEAQGPAPAVTPGQATAREALRSAPTMFIENVGQFDERARLQVRGGRGAMWLTEDALWVTVMEQTPPPPGKGSQGVRSPRRQPEAELPRGQRPSAPGAYGAPGDSSLLLYRQRPRAVAPRRARVGRRALC